MNLILNTNKTIPNKNDNNILYWCWNQNGEIPCLGRLFDLDNGLEVHCSERKGLVIKFSEIAYWVSINSMGLNEYFVWLRKIMTKNFSDIYDEEYEQIEWITSNAADATLNYIDGLISRVKVSNTSINDSVYLCKDNDGKFMVVQGKTINPDDFEWWVSLDSLEFVLN